MTRVRASGVVFLLANACRPELESDLSSIRQPTVIAVKSEPAEVKPGAQLTLTALVARPVDGSDASVPVWSYCTAPKPIAENNVVAAACIGMSAATEIDHGNPIQAEMPSAACVNFGPDAPRGGYRPRDPDVTGGYYQPVRVELESRPLVFDLSRVQCNLANASADSALVFAKEYSPNRNPSLLPLKFTIDGGPVSLDRIAPGAALTLEASWVDSDAEHYAYFDPESQSIVRRREAMQVAWFATGGRFARGMTGRAENDAQTATSNTWTAPFSGGPVRLWVVLHDDRGGVDFAEYEINVAS